MPDDVHDDILDGMYEDEGRSAKQKSGRGGSDVPRSLHHPKPSDVESDEFSKDREDEFHTGSQSGSAELGPMGSGNVQTLDQTSDEHHIVRATARSSRVSEPKAYPKRRRMFGGRNDNSQWPTSDVTSLNTGASSSLADVRRSGGYDSSEPLRSSGLPRRSLDSEYATEESAHAAESMPLMAGKDHSHDTDADSSKQDAIAGEAFGWDDGSDAGPSRFSGVRSRLRSIASRVRGGRRFSMVGGSNSD